MFCALQLCGCFLSVEEAPCSLPPSCVDAGKPDGGTRPADAGDYAVEDAGVMRRLSLKATLDTLYVGGQDVAHVTATLTDESGPAADVPVRAETTLGRLWLSDGGLAAPGLPERTDARGEAQFLVSDTGSAGRATVTVTDEETGVAASTDVTFLVPAFISYVATTCGAHPCTVMGVKGSGLDEVARVQFVVRNAQFSPVPNYPVVFSLNGAPAGTTGSIAAVTDAAGAASCEVQAGPSIGELTVTATIAGSVASTSPRIGVRGAKPSNLGFTIQCAKVNLAAYLSLAPPLALTSACTVTLVDRQGNPVGRRTSVQLSSEAGSVPANITNGLHARHGEHE